jgi:hypothetical protein
MKALGNALSTFSRQSFDNTISKGLLLRRVKFTPTLNICLEIECSFIKMNESLIPQPMRAENTTLPDYLPVETATLWPTASLERAPTLYPPVFSPRPSLSYLDLPGSASRIDTQSLQGLHGISLKRNETDE